VRSGTNAYRPDIDGLRAVAVLSVLFYHAGLPPFFGGFIGVDIFFVISGYLITGILFADLQRDDFSIARFYERRIRRIFPALYVTIAFTLTGATVLFSSVDLERLHDAMPWLAAFVSNVYFMNHTGYFDAASEQNAILQTWSLAIEEQFYVVFPLALALGHRYARPHLRSIVLAVALLSLAFSIAIVDRDARTAFFSMPGRLWELMAGALLALGLFPSATSAIIRNWIAAIGAALVAASLVLLTNDTPFPGANAVPVCLGTALMIWANTSGSTLVGKVLSLRPMVFVGLISYSLYLFHWPMLTFARYWLKADFTLVHALVVLCAAFIAAAASWRYVETPFRRSGPRLPRRSLFVGAVALMIALAGTSMTAATWYAGQLTAFDKTAEAARDLLKAEPCMIKDTETLKDWPAARCALHGQGGVIAIWGDSFAAQYFDAFRRLAQQNDRPLILLAEGSCPPIAGLAVPNRPGCEPFNRDVFAKLQREAPAVVVLSADWMVYEKKKTLAEAVVDKFALLSQTIDALRAAGSKVLVIGPSPMFPAAVPRIAAAEGGEASTTKASYSRKFEDLFHTLERAGRIDYFPTHSVFCDASMFCRYKEGDDLLFWDAGHMTERGAALVLDRLTAKFPYLKATKPPGN
jgi:peptidoglycan/LPS O-acetylase OafA/YrhL